MAPKYRFWSQFQSVIRFFKMHLVLSRRVTYGTRLGDSETWTRWLRGESWAQQALCVAQAQRAQHPRRCLWDRSRENGGPSGDADKAR